MAKRDKIGQIGLQQAASETLSGSLTHLLLESQTVKPCLVKPCLAFSDPDAELGPMGFRLVLSQVG